eukprot:GHVQ01039182.1.p1 GENE.GHVQ01039182.1~~GHVQ01039182.1.p1  ORF type:complete len:185 (+),score=11.37 GHVQ01039182.1:101-655(+)
MAASSMHSTPPRLLRTQPRVVAEAQRVMPEERWEVVNLLNLPTLVKSKRALKNWRLGWLLIVLILSAFCGSHFVTPVVAMKLSGSFTGSSDAAPWTAVAEPAEPSGDTFKTWLVTFLAIGFAGLGITGPLGFIYWGLFREINAPRATLALFGGVASSAMVVLAFITYLLFLHSRRLRDCFSAPA